MISNNVIKRKAVNTVIILILSIISISMLFPLVWMISTALKSNSEVFIIPPKWIPNPPKWENFIKVFEVTPILNGFKNSLVIVFCVIPLGIFFTTLSAFSFSKLNFRGKNIIFMALLGTIMVPFPVVLIPQFMMFSQIGWIDSIKPLIIPGTMGNIGAMFFLVQYLKGIPNPLIESAKIDGAGYFKIFYKIIVPLIKPAIATQIIFWFMGIWNDLLGPIIYLNSEEKLTLTATIATLNSFYASQSDFPLIMAGSIISIIPLLLVFIVFQKQIIESLAISGIKG